MGCLKLIYCENETLFPEEHSGKNEAVKLRVWVNPEREFLGVDVEEASQGSDFIYDNNNKIGLTTSILEPGFGAAWDAVRTNPAAYTKSASVISKLGGAGLVMANAAVTGYTIKTELDNGKFNTHSIVNGTVTVIGVGLTVAGLIVSAPAIAIVGAGLGVGYGIAQIAGFDDWIDNTTDNWGKNIIK